MTDILIRLCVGACRAFTAAYGLITILRALGVL